MSAVRRPAWLTPGSRPLLIAVFSLSSTLGYVAMIQVLPVLLVPMADDLGVSRTAIAGASTVSTLVGALVALPVGRLLDARGGRALMTAGSAIGAAGVVAWSQAQSLTGLYTSFVLIGAAIVMSTYEAAFAVIVVTTTAEHRDRAILAITMIAGLATYLVYPVMGWMNTEFGWRTCLLILAAVMAGASIPAHLWAIPGGAAHRAQAPRREGSSLREVLRRKDFWLLLTSFVLQAASAAAFLLLVVTYLRDVGHSERVATSVPIVIGVLQVLSRLVLSTVARRAPMESAAAFAFAAQGAGLAILPLVGLSIPLTLLCVAAVGLGQGVSVIARPSLVADRFGVAHFATVLAAITVPMALARAGSPLLAAWLADRRFLVLCGVAALLGSLALLPLRTRRRPSPPPSEESVDLAPATG